MLRDTDTVQSVGGLSLRVISVLVSVGVKIATAQKSVMAIAAGLILSLILVFIGFTCSFGKVWLAWQKNGRIFGADCGLDR
jgi:hypothetical protein